MSDECPPHDDDMDVRLGEQELDWMYVHAPCYAPGGRWIDVRAIIGELREWRTMFGVTVPEWEDRYPEDEG